MFELNDEEMTILVSQNVISTINHFGGANPSAFTEQGIAMLSSVLDSPCGSYFGMLRDQYGIEWMIEFDGRGL